MNQNPSLPYLWMLCGSLSFAAMAALTHALRGTCDWQIIALVRAFIACAIAVLLAKAAGAELVLWRPATMWMRSIAGSISMVCSFYAFTHLRISDVMTLTNTFPIWVALLSWPLLRQAPGLAVWVSVVSGVAGVALIQQPHFQDGNLAAGIALLASFATAVAMIGLHRLVNIDMRAVVAHFSGVAVLFCLASFLVFDHDFTVSDNFSRHNLGLLLAIGLTATVGQLFLTKAFAAGPPAKVSVVGLTQIVFAMLIDAIFWQHTFDTPTLLGMGLVIAPTAWLLTRTGHVEPSPALPFDGHQE
ncbi:MAG: DMT family transporter [Planctomycetia bacterium]|nr:DMT family transporter [Planctomycetia bacterium]